MRRLPLALLLVLAPPVSLAGDGTDVKDAISALGESPISTLLLNMPEDVQTYDKHVTTLANPFFEGRAPGLRGNLPNGVGWAGPQNHPDRPRMSAR